MGGWGGACFHSHCLESVLSTSRSFSFSLFLFLSLAPRFFSFGPAVSPLLHTSFSHSTFQKTVFRICLFFFFIPSKKKREPRIELVFQASVRLFSSSLSTFILKEKGTPLMLFVSVCLFYFNPLLIPFLSLAPSLFLFLSRSPSIYPSISLFSISFSLRCGASGRQTGGV